MFKRVFKKALGTFFISCSILLMVLVALGLGVSIGAYRSVAGMLPATNALDTYRPQLTTKIFSSEGVLMAQLYKQHRELATLSEIPSALREATVAIEDERFYKHHGLDFKGLGRALKANLRSKSYAQGGSTITQQLARSIFLTRKKTLSRKAQELVLALEMERRLSKDEILQLYLNQVYYGSGAYGVKVAAQTYFGKDLKDLSLAECALLAGLPQRPSSYSPFRNAKTAIVRRNTVLRKMAELGKITPGQLKTALEEPLKLADNHLTGVSVLKAPYFTSYIIGQLIDLYGPDLVYKGGLRVYTTVNLKMQEAAQQAVRDGVERLRRRHASQGALVAIDPYTGYVKALVGGVDFSKSQFNRATQAKRQPGSSFKPILYTAAFDNGFTPSTLVVDALKTYGTGSHKWTPHNYDHRYRGTVSIETAVALSINTVAVKVADHIGIGVVNEYGHKMGIISPLEPYLSTALGASVATPLELCSAYGTIATEGVHAQPQAIKRIEDASGKVLFEGKPRLNRVVRKSTMREMKQCLRAVVTRGTGTYVQRLGYTAYGKTGTTSDDRDAWFAGFTKDLVCVVWVGNDDYSRMYNVFGGTGCGPIWVNFMKQAVPAMQSEREASGINIPDFAEINPKPKIKALKEEGMQVVTLCRDSGLLATPYCPHTVNKLLPVDQIPTKKCNLHGPQKKQKSNSNQAADNKPPGEQATTPTGEDQAAPVIRRPVPKAKPDNTAKPQAEPAKAGGDTADGAL